VIGQRIAGVNMAWEEMCADPELLAVYDIDDNLLELDPANEVPYSIYAPLAEATARNIELANVVTVSTPNLAARLSKINPNVVVLPNCLDLSWIASIQFRHPDEINVGWAGSMFHQQDWPGMGEQLLAYAKKEPRARFHSIGADYMSPWVRPKVGYWGTMLAYWDQMNFDIGIAPLVDTPFNSMKSWIKVLEYSGKGIVPVASAVGQYPEFIEDGVNGFLIHDISEWPDKLLQLSDRALREQMQDAAMGKAMQFTIDKQIHLWQAVYEGDWGR
jgi:glycosyltransferase involved in cell wall biosynthesis